MSQIKRGDVVVNINNGKIRRVTKIVWNPDDNYKLLHLMDAEGNDYQCAMKCYRLASASEILEFNKAISRNIHKMLLDETGD